MENCLILDFDGVIVNNHTINENVTKRAASFLSDNTHLKPKHAMRVNREKYRKFGHTLFLTNHINNNHKLDNEELTIKDFNDYIYTTDFIKTHCLSHLDSHDVELYTEWATLINETKRDGVFDDVIIFSNAPSNWISHSIKTLEEMSCINLNVDDIISVPENFNERLKPDKEPYDLLTESRVYDDSYVYIDDNVTNLQYTRWINCLFDPMKKRNASMKTNYDNHIFVLSSPTDLYSVIN